MADKFGYTFQLPPKSAPDVAERRFTTTVDGVEKSVEMLGADVETHEIVVDQDATVNVALSDVDDAGNASSPSVYEFVAKDEVAPPAPGALGVLAVREIFEEPAPEEPETPAEPEAPAEE